MHTHTRAGVAVSTLEEGLMPLNQIALQFHGRVSYHDYEGIALDLEERDRIVADFGDQPVMILRNHGLLTCGETVGAAFIRMYYLERACNIQLRVMATGRDIMLPSDAVCERTAKQLTRFPLGQYEWPAILRRVQSECPDYNR